MNTEKYLVFLLDNENYAVQVKSTKEVITIMDFTQVPKVPAFIKGVINLRGKIIPVIDLRLKFGIESKPYDSKTCIIVMDIKLKDKKSTMGVIVDTVVEVVAVAESEIAPPPEFNKSSDLEFIKGVGKVKDKVIWILNLDRILNTDELVLINRIKEES